MCLAKRGLSLLRQSKNRRSVLFNFAQYRYVPYMDDDDRITIPLTLSKTAYARLSRLLDKAAQLHELRGMPSHAEVVRNAIRLYEWYLDKKLGGYELVVQRDGVAEAIEFLFA